ncbi:MAG: medium chain dehydrogenase/reductase family protein [Leptolyngbyaceae cyanobacterium MO_188.B28]|nr:medium chain dehydrogenase/reductase family protein [Leptolyngbyaceae cyanobacterium MO_188.B28]
MKYKRVLIDRLGGPEVLQIVEDELPEPKRGEVRVRILSAGVSYADMLMREGVHPETPHQPFTPGWDLVGVVDKLGDDAFGFKVDQRVAALPVTGGYAEFICLPQTELIAVPPEVDPAEAICLVMNYVTAYQMMHRSVQAASGQRVLIHAATGGVGTALLQLGRLAELEMYGTASSRNHELVSSLGATPIDYRQVDFVEEILRLTGNGVDVVFDGIGGTHLWRSYKALRTDGRVVAYGFTSTLRGGMLTRRRSRLRGFAIPALCMAGAALIPDKKRITVYSIQTLKRLKPAWYREDLRILIELLSQEQIKPIIAERIPLVEVRHAHELLGHGAVKGKIVLRCYG